MFDVIPIVALIINAKVSSFTPSLPNVYPRTERIKTSQETRRASLQNQAKKRHSPGVENQKSLLGARVAEVGNKVRVLMRQLQHMLWEARSLNDAPDFQGSLLFNESTNHEEQ